MISLNVPAATELDAALKEHGRIMHDATSINITNGAAGKFGDVECVINISAILGMSSPAASHHLRSLRDSRLIVSRRAGKEVYYKASDTEESLLLQKLLKTTFKDLPV